MSAESYASIYAKAVREARAAEHAQDESRRATQKRKDKAEKYVFSKDPPQGHRVYRKGAMWAAETPAWGRPIDEVWGDMFHSRAAAVNAAWRHFEGEKQLPLQRRGGKGRLSVKGGKADLDEFQALYKKFEDWATEELYHRLTGGFLRGDPPGRGGMIRGIIDKEHPGLADRARYAAHRLRVPGAGGGKRRHNGAAALIKAAQQLKDAMRR